MIAATLTDYLADSATELPPQVEAADAIAAVTALHERDGGATFNLYFGSLRGQELYAVALYPERTARLQGRSISPRILAIFLRRNADLLRDPRNSIGSWFNETNQATYLDVTTTLSDRQQAVTLGIRYNQIAIYDLKHRSVIETEGTGEEIAQLPEETERLPVLERGMNHEFDTNDTTNDH